MSAAFEGDVEEAARLLKEGADVKAINSYGVNAMQLAADTANTELIRLLLKAGADPESPNPDGETALHVVARSGNVEAAKLLLKAGAKVDALEQFGGQTPLMWAAARRHPQMVELLLSKGADVNARGAVRDYKRVATAESRAAPRDRGGFTPLMYAARGNCGECVEVLLKHKADVNLADPSFVVPLSIAMMNGNWDIAKRLVEAGADVNQWDMNGSSPLHVAIANMNSAGSRNPLDQDKPNKAPPRERDQDAAGSRREPESAALLGRGLRCRGRSRHDAVPRGLRYWRHRVGEAAAGARCESQARHFGRPRPHHHGLNGRRRDGGMGGTARPAPGEGESEGAPAGAAEGTPAGKPQANPQVQLISPARQCGCGREVGGQGPPPRAHTRRLSAALRGARRR